MSDDAIFPRGGTDIPGLSLRDCFALIAMHAIVTSTKRANVFDEVARVSYALADAMMTTRKGDK